jgi:hypothetical protein
MKANILSFFNLMSKCVNSNYLTLFFLSCIHLGFQFSLTYLFFTSSFLSYFVNFFIFDLHTNSNSNALLCLCHNNTPVQRAFIRFVQFSFGSRVVCFNRVHKLAIINPKFKNFHTHGKRKKINWWETGSGHIWK